MLRATTNLRYKTVNKTLLRIMYQVNDINKSLKFEPLKQASGQKPKPFDFQEFSLRRVTKKTAKVVLQRYFFL